MSKKNRDEMEQIDEVQEVQSEGTEVASEATEASADAPSTSKGRAVMLTDPDTGAQVKRAEVIKAAYEGGMSRSDIVKLLDTKYGHKVAYQIVFAGTKGLKAPAKPAAEAAA